MYHHADQSWQKMPAFLSAENEDILSTRIAEYAHEKQLSRILVVYHGGEPLLAGIESLKRITNKIRSTVKSNTVLDFSLQTNGTLIDEKILDLLSDLKISVSLSIDGPEGIQNKHRPTHAGKPTFAKVENTLKLLLKRQDIFSGVIAVIDVGYSPLEVLEFFDTMGVLSLDFLLPDANYHRLPPGRDKNPNAYKNWLIDCFDLWFDKYPHIRLRFFDAILDSIVGLPSKTDALGFGDVSLLTIETDGSYHDLDVLKVAFEGASDLQMHIQTHGIAEAANTAQIKAHRNLLQKENLSQTCLSCDVVDICAGGAIPHRHSNNGFDNPSIYCDELYTLINHAKSRLTKQLEQEVRDIKSNNQFDVSKLDLNCYEDTNYSYALLSEIVSVWGLSQLGNLKQALEFCKTKNPEKSDKINSILTLPDKELAHLSVQPSVFTWTTVVNAAEDNRVINSIDGNLISPDYNYIENLIELLDTSFNVQRINRTDEWLRLPFGSKILYENNESTLKGIEILNQAYQLINTWDPNVLREIKLIAPEVQFIKDSTAHPEKIVSFSDNSVPGALYITIKLKDKYIEPSDIADSILHEYRHQKLYLLQRISDVVLLDVPLVSSPWREELRPPSGLYHAIYVFSFLQKFWTFLSSYSDQALAQRAGQEISVIDNRIQTGLQTLKKTKLTEVGINLLTIIEVGLIKKTNGI